MATIHLEDDITVLPGIGPKSQRLLSKLDIFTVRDLLHHIPARYLDLSQPTTTSKLTLGNLVSLQLKIASPHSFYTRNGKLITSATASDNNGSVQLVWFNSPYITKLINPDHFYTVAGKVSQFSHRLCLVSPTIEVYDPSSFHTRGYVPIYPQTTGVTSKWLRQKTHLALTLLDFKDPLTHDILKKHHLIPQKKAISNIHFPMDLPTLDQSDLRLSFNHHLLTNLHNQLEILSLPASPAINFDRHVHQNTLRLLPFSLTADQVATIDRLYKDLSQTTFSHRLIQGETGSGKTVTLIFAAHQCLANRLSFALLAPTQILAEQHRQTFEQFGLYPQQIKLVTAAHHLREQQQPTIYIGTHSLLHQLPAHLPFPICLLAIDEQHKFGVQQRAELSHRNPTPHLVNLSATPIPRTVALGLLGELKITNIKSKITGKKPVKTWLVTPTRYKESNRWITQQLKNNQKIFIVCPNIKTSINQVASVDSTYSHYQKLFGSLASVFKLHGSMAQEEKNKTLEQFIHQKSAILVSTSIIEVGIDIPTANIIIIHSAERFGLAQLHQLRGRVGRGKDQGYCILVPSQDDEEENKRLNLMTKYHHGLILAKLDLKLRGAGEIFGTKQHGYLPVRLKHFWDKNLYQQARQTAHQLILSQPQQANELVRTLESC